MDYLIAILNISDIISYKKLIDTCFGISNTIEQYEQYSLREDYIIWVIKDENKVIGTVTQYSIDLFTFSFQPCLMLFNVAVDSDYRKKDIGRLLLKFVIDKAKKDGYKSISLTCLDSAYPAHKLYESVGFHKANSFKYSIDLDE